MIPLELEETENTETSKNKVVNLRLPEREFAKSNLWACHMAVFSSFLTDLICLYIPLINFTDQSLVEGFKLFIENQENKISVFYYSNLVYVFVLYFGILLSLFWENYLVWNILLNWANVGILLTFLSLPFNRSNFVFKLATSLINMMCLRVRFNIKFNNN